MSYEIVDWYDDSPLPPTRLPLRYDRAEFTITQAPKGRTFQIAEVRGGNRTPVVVHPDLTFEGGPIFDESGKEVDRLRLNHKYFVHLGESS